MVHGWHVFFIKLINVETRTAFMRDALVSPYFGRRQDDTSVAKVWQFNQTDPLLCSYSLSVGVAVVKNFVGPTLSIPSSLDKEGSLQPRKAPS